MTTSRQSIATLANDLQEVLAWGEAAEAANAAICAERDAAIARCASIQEDHDALEATLAQVVAEKDATIAAKDVELAAALTSAEDWHNLANSRLDQIAAKDAEIARLEQENADYHQVAEEQIAEIHAQRAEIARLKALLRPVQFTTYNEMKSVPSLPLPPIRFIYENELIAPGETRYMPPNVDHLRAKFAQIKANEPDVKMVVLDQEGWLPGGSGSAQIEHPEYFVTLLTVAHEFWDEVSQYSYPKRYYGFVTGSPAENETRYNTLVAHTQQTQEITDLCTFLCPSFYVPTAIEDPTKRAKWMDGYFSLCELVAPGKDIIPTLWPRFHSHPADWLTGPIWDEMIRRIYARQSCMGYIIFGRSGGDDPDPRPLNLPWWQADEAFRAERLA